jgi:phosphate uptake regulator
VPPADDAVDELQGEVRDLAIREIRSGRVDAEVGLRAVLIANKLESIADITSHIAESVVFIIQAKQIRHQRSPGSPVAP